VTLSAAASRFFTRKMTTDFCLAATKSLRSGVAPVEGVRVTLVIRRITIAVLAAFLAGAVLAVPASSKGGPAVVAKKKAKKCKKGKKGKKAKKRKGCKRGGSSVGLPGEATPASPKQPNTPPPPPDNPVLQVESVVLTSGTVLGGNSTSGQVTLDDEAPAGGQPVDLTSSLPARVTVPASVVVASGQKTASFQVNTTSGPSPVTATLTGSIGTSNAATSLKVVDRPSVASVKLQRECFKAGTNWSANRVTLDIPAPDDTDVALDSTDPASLFLPLTTVTVPEDSTSALFTVNVLAPPSVAGPVTITATAPSTLPQSDSAPVSLTDPETHANGLTLNPDTVTPDTPSTATVTLDCEAPTGGTVVNLSSVDPSHVHVPATVTVPADELSVNFQVTTEPDTPDDNYDISANVQGDPPEDKVITPLHVVSVLPT
jgi:hypothetical protein